MGERGPKPDIVKRLTPEQRAELDEAIVEGRRTKTDLFECFGRPHGVSYSAFCNYAAQLESRARHRYVGELLNKTFGNLPDSDIDVRAKGIVMAVLDRLAADVLQDGELKPKDLRDVVHAYDLLRRGAIAEAKEDRRQREWEVLRMAGVAEAATWIKKELAAEIGADAELRERLDQAVDRCCGRIDKPKDGRITQSLLKDLARKHNWEKDVRRMFHHMWGLSFDDDEEESRPVTEEQLREQIWQVGAGQLDPSMRPSAEPKPAPSAPTRGEVYDYVDDVCRGKVPIDDDDS